MSNEQYYGWRKPATFGKICYTTPDCSVAWVDAVGHSKTESPFTEDTGALMIGPVVNILIDSAGCGRNIRQRKADSKLPDITLAQVEHPMGRVAIGRAWLDERGIERVMVQYLYDRGLIHWRGDEHPKYQLHFTGHFNVVFKLDQELSAERIEQIEDEVRSLLYGRVDDSIQPISYVSPLTFDGIESHEVVETLPDGEAWQISWFTDEEKAEIFGDDWTEDQAEDQIEQSIKLVVAACLS